MKRGTILLAALLPACGAWCVEGPKEAPALSAASGELEAARRAAFAAYLAGDFDAAASHYRYLVTLKPADADSTVDLALALREAGKPQEAAAQWLKASLLLPQDPFVWNQRGWNYLAMGRHREARDSFQSAIRLSSSTPAAAEAYFGLGLSDSLDGKTKAAFPSLQAATSRSPYLLAAAAAELGRMVTRLKRLPQAIPFYTMSLSQDPLQTDVSRALAEVYEKTGQAQAAWQAYKMTLDMDPVDEESRRRERKIAGYVAGKPLDSLPLRRLARPLMRESSPEEPSQPLRVLMFSDPAGKPRHLSRFYFMTSSGFRLADANLGDIDKGGSNNQWEVLFRADNRVIEVRDAFNNIRYVTKQAFTIIPQEGGTTLIKNPEIDDIAGVDAGDRELRGKVEIIPTPMGFHVLNQIPLEEYLFSVIGEPFPDGSPAEAYKAAAVLMRSRVLEMKRKAAPNPERADLCDSSYCLPYEGLTKESIAASSAVRATRGVTIVPGAGGSLEQHLSCGWGTASGIQDRAEAGPALDSPSALERRIRAYPMAGDYDDASARVPAPWVRWARILDPALLRARMERTTLVGALRKVKVASRDASGRVLRLEVSGPHGETVLKDEAAMTAFLSPGSLRSTLFTVQPLYKGKTIERLLLWGAGTGHGRGLCLAGAIGQAHLGRNYYEILKHYFPQAAFPGLPASYLDPPRKDAKAAVRPAPGRRLSPSKHPPRRRRRRPPTP